MADRFSIGSGLASDPVVWDGGTTVPVSGDRVLITVGTTIELDGAYEWGDDSTSTIVINTVSTNRGIVLRGKLSHSRSVNSSITCRGGFQIDSGGEHDIGTVASPIPQGVVAATYVNKSNASPSLGKYNYEVQPGGRFTYVGVFRKRHTVLTAAAAASDTTIFVEDATGWQVGDLLHITGDDTGLHQNVAIAGGYTPGSLTVPLSAALVTSKRLNIAVGNATSNAILTSHSLSTRGGWSSNTASTEIADSREIRNTSMVDLLGAHPMSGGVLFRTVDNFSGIRYPNPYKSLDSIVFGTTVSNNGCFNTAVGANPAYLPVLNFNDCVFLHLNTSSAGGVAGFGSAVTASNCLFGNVTLMSEGNYLSSITDSKIVITNPGSTPIGSNGGNAGVFKNVKISGRAYTGAQYSANNTVRLKYIGCDFGVALPTSTGQHIIFQIAPVYSSMTFTDCNFAANALILAVSQAKMTTDSSVKLLNKNADVTLQEDWFYNYTAVRNNVEVFRGTSSIAIKPITAGIEAVRTQEIFCPNGSSIRVIGYIKSDALFYNGGGAGWYAPTVSISGRGVTTGTVNGVAGVAPSFAGTASATWEKYDITVTNASGLGGYFALSYAVNPRSVTTGTVYFDGVTEPPFINRVRHYGFRFDEANPVRFVNPTTSADEATAAGYTGVTVTWATSDVVLGADKTFQALYDQTQYMACLPAGLPFAAPIVGVGLAGAASLFAQGNVTTTGYTLNGNGSLSMDVYTLTASLPWDYTYTGGTFSQATTVPSFGGGQLNIGAAGTYTLGMSASTIISMTPTAPGTYAMGASTFSGTVDLRNTSAHAITVQLPTGTIYTTASNVGGTITVALPATYQSVTVSGVVAGSRVQIYDATNSVELFNDTSGYAWTDSVAAAAPRAIRVRIANQSGATAYNFVEANIGTCGTTSPSNAVTYLASQTLDTVYNANALDGSAVTGITISDGIDRMVINIAGGSVSWPQIYAYNVYWLTTSAGIVDDGSIITATDTANYRVTLFKIRNSSVTPLSITGGFGVDSTTGTVAPLIDVVGSTGNIYQTPDHVVPYQTTGTYAITGDISTVLTAVSNVPASVLSAASATPISSDVRKVNNITVNGVGTSISPWGP